MRNETPSTGSLKFDRKKCTILSKKNTPLVCLNQIEDAASGAKRVKCVDKYEEIEKILLN